MTDRDSGTPTNPGRRRLLQRAGLAGAAVSLGALDLACSLLEQLRFIPAIDQVKIEGPEIPEDLANSKTGADVITDILMPKLHMEDVKAFAPKVLRGSFSVTTDESVDYTVTFHAADDLGKLKAVEVVITENQTSEQYQVIYRLPYGFNDPLLDTAEPIGGVSATKAKADEYKDRKIAQDLIHVFNERIEDGRPVPVFRVYVRPNQN